MSRIRAAVWPSLRETRVLMTLETGQSLLKARLGASPQHPHALGTLLEAVSLWQGQRVHAVVAADVRAPFYGRCPGLTTGAPADNEWFTLDVIPIGMPRARRCIDGLGSFGALHELLRQEVAR